MTAGHLSPGPISTTFSDVTAQRRQRGPSDPPIAPSRGSCELRVRRGTCLECRTLEAGIGDHGGFETHEAFVARLRARHGRKAGFWSRVEEPGGASGRR